MSKYNKYERGSEWRKWDLHVHTPSTKLNNNYTVEDTEESTWNKFCEKIFNSDVSVLGITDYFSIDNYLNFVQIFKHKYPNSEKVFFPNIEFRLDSKNSKEQHIQLHVILDNKQTTIGKINNFLTRLELVSTDNISLTNKYCTPEDLREVGYDKAMVKFDTLKNLLHKNFSNNEYLIVGVANGYGSLRPNGPNDGRGSEYAKELDKIFDVFFGNSSNTQFFLNEKEGRKRYNLPPKPVLTGCDAHSFEALDNKLGKEFIKKDSDENVSDYSEITWIKSDPTFEGLRQIKFEPKERVKIQATKPEEKAGYYVIDSVELDEDNFWKDKIYLSPNLNTIIGGRSTGKSTFLRCVSKKIDSNSIINDEFIDKHVNGVKINWQDNELAENRDIEFFPQNYMYEIANDSKKTDKLIERIIREKDKNEILITYEKFIENNRTIIINQINTLFKLQGEIDVLISELKEKGDKEGIEKEIKVLDAKIKSLASNYSLSEEELKEFEEISKNISQCNANIKLLDSDIIHIDKLKAKNIFDTSLEYEFNVLSDNTRNSINDIYKTIISEAQQKWIENLERYKEIIERKKAEINDEINNNENKEIYKNGIAYIESNQQYKELQEKLNNERKKLSIILNIEKKLQLQENQRNELKNKIVELHKQFYDKANELINALKLEHSGIMINPKCILKTIELKQFLSERLNLRGVDRQNFVNDFVDNYELQIQHRISDFIQNALEKNIDYKGIYADKSQPTVVAELVSTNWFYISYQLIYQNDTFSDMSQGKQAFVILKLLLEFSDKKCPILIDQPEDSLDNRAIYKELVQYLKEKKKERQIIIVTHNPNVVVSADAEQIIVANQQGKDSKNKASYKFKYVSGSLEFTKPKENNNDLILESQGIREHVCEILEGGNEAFKNREKKYSI